MKSAIVSSGPYDLAARAQKELGIDEIHANRLTIENGTISDKIEIMVPDSQKKEIGLKVMRKLAISPCSAASIGDSDADIPLAQVVGLSIAYNSKSESLNKQCAYVLKYGELRECIGIIGKMT